MSDVDDKPRTLDIASVAADPRYDLKISSAENEKALEARLRIEEADAGAVRRRDEIAFWAALVGVFTGASACIWVYLHAPDASDKLLAKTFLQAIFVGSIGFLLGRKKR